MCDTCEEDDNHAKRYAVGEESQGNVGGALVATDLLVRVFSMGTNV